MKNIFIFLCILCVGGVVFSEPTMSVFSTDPRTGFAGSASRQSTLFTMGTEADSIHAKGIVDIVRPFFATGYLDNGGVILSPNLQGVGAIPLSSDTAIGVIADYKINAFRDEKASTNIFTDTSNTRTEDSTYNVRLAFGWKDFGIHSRISKTGNETSTIEEAQIQATTKDTKREYEIGISYREQGVYQFYSTLGTIYDRTTSVTDSYVDSDGATSIIEKNNALSVFAFPQIEFPVSIGPIVTLRTGINFGMDVYSLGDSFATYTTVSQKGDVTEQNIINATFSDRKNLTVGIDGGASLAWFTESVVLLAEPYIGFDYARRKDLVTSLTKTDSDGSTSITAPNDLRAIDSYDSYAGCNVGISIKATDWLEIRGGLSYGLNWDSTVTNITLGTTKETSKEYDFHLTSNFMTGFGVGFILAKNFLLDIHVESTERDFGFDSIGVSALYRL